MQIYMDDDGNNVKLKQEAKETTSVSILLDGYANKR